MRDLRGMAAHASSKQDFAARLSGEAPFANAVALDFVKYHGAGNDFVLVDGRQPKDHRPKWNRDQVAFLCDRHFGIGADGLIVLEPPTVEGTQFHMAYFNADGCLSSFCGNGARCATAFAFALGALPGRKAQFTAADGPHTAEVLEDGRVRLVMGDVAGLRRDGEAFVLDTGSPHWVQFLEKGLAPDQAVQELLAMDLLAFARNVRYGAAYAAEGINVNVVLEVEGALYMRTYERGVENETLSCGTGVTAAALAQGQRLGLEGAAAVHVHTRGGELDVEFRNAQGNFTGVHLIGPAQRVFEGRFTT